MRIISRKRLREFWENPGYNDSEAPLKHWYKVTKNANWKTPNEVVQTFGSADPNVKVASGKTAAVFDIGGNKYRLVAMIHYNRSMVFVHKVMTHKEYDEEHWKGEL